MKASDFLGLSKKAAQDHAEAKNLIFQLVRIDNNTFLNYPDTNAPDYKNMDRLYVEIDNGKIVKAIIM